MKDLSFSIAVADAFLEKYLQKKPETNLETIELFNTELPEFDFTTASAKYKIMHGKEHSEQEKARWESITEIIENFKSADKYVFAVPMWNFSIPYKLKHFLDILIQPSYTFTVNEQGNYQSLLPDRPVFIAYARGGEYKEESKRQFDMQKPYLELALNFMGLKNIESVTIEPTLMGGAETAESKKSQAVEKARKITEEF
jgi:FMN-dependent NADH-azoreductase